MEVLLPEPLAEDLPYALKSPRERERRLAMLDLPHITHLEKYLQSMRSEQGSKYAIPHFDPCDGGGNARLLFLLEAPGPKAIVSSFVSRNNPDPTAKNLCELLAGSGIERSDTLIWNIVPWYVGDGIGRIRPVNSSDITAALPYLPGLLERLPNLLRVVLVGLKAQSAAKRIRALTSVPFVAMPHPSGQVFNVKPHKRAEAQETLRSVALLLQPEPLTPKTI